MRFVIPAVLAAIFSGCAAKVPPGAASTCDAPFRAQSPVAITGAVADAGLPPVVARYPAGEGRLFDTGHTLQVALPAELTLEVGDRRFQAQQFHLHWPGEHRLGTETFAAEIHVVHASHEHDTAVLATWVREGARNPAWEPFFAALPAPGDTVRLPDVDLYAMLGATAEVDVPRLFRYCGSLTTPPYTQGVAWLVRLQPIEMDAAQLQRLREAMERNSRDVQPLNGRRIEYRGR